MNKLTTRIAGLAILATVAAATAAQAETVRISDLNLATTKGVTTYFNRVDKVAYRMCSQGRGAATRNTKCEAIVKAEAGDKLAAIKQTTQYATR